MAEGSLACGGAGRRCSFRSVAAVNSFTLRLTSPINLPAVRAISMALAGPITRNAIRKDYGQLQHSHAKYVHADTTLPSLNGQNPKHRLPTDRGRFGGGG